MVDVKEYYDNPLVLREIFDYSMNKWVAVEAVKNGKRVFFRYRSRNGPPLYFRDPTSLKDFLKKYINIGVRTVYASINVYKSLKRREDTSSLDNIIHTSPIWDIDGSLSNIKLTLDVAGILIEELEKFGVRKSVFLKWSGRGLHIHIHEKSISADIYEKYHPLDVAYSIVEYIIIKIHRDMMKIVRNINNVDRPFKVENKIDIQRVFTAPLSLHRELDIVAVCFKPEKMYDFNITWTDPLNFVHDKSWREYIVGECDTLAEEAIKMIGGYIGKYVVRQRRSEPQIISKVKKIPVIRGKIGRFQVMALLQAVRYYILRGDIDKAKSFGLNRAIFYAWAKYHKPRYGMSRETFRKRLYGDKISKERCEQLGDETAYLTSDGWFTIGDTPQYPEDFDRQIIKKIDAIVPFNVAWEAAIKYVNRFSIDILLSQSKFYNEVYLPVRDTFIKIVQEHIASKEYEK